MNRPQPNEAGEAEGRVGRVGRYELLRPLGAGGMGEVFLARVVGAAGFEARVVIKRILPHLAQDPAFVRRFVDEGKLTATLRHAGIAQVLDLGVEDGVVFLAMEYVDGRDLRALSRLAAAYGPAPSVALRVHILARVLEALDYAHRATDEAGRPAGVIHRDVSPSNVMLSRAGEVKLLDFGIARAVSRVGDVTTTGTIQGKYGYMSPEQAAGAHLDPRSDQFSVGVMAWELFAGRRPFDGPNDLKTLDNVRTVDPGPLHVAAPDTPPEVSEAVARMLAKEPADRFPTADDARRALQSYLNRVGATPGARDVAQWVEAVTQAAPPGAGDAPLSFDEALRLSLDGAGPGTPAGGQAAAGMGAHTATAAPASAGHTATAAAPSEPPVALVATQPAPSLAVPPPAAPPSASPSVPRPAPIAQEAPQAQGAVGFPPATPQAGAPTTVTVVSPGRRSFTALLVGFNILLLGAVAVLLLQSRDAPADGPPTDDAQPTAQLDPPSVDAGIPGRSGPATAGAERDAGPDEEPDATPDATPDAAPDASPDVVPDASPDVVPDVVPDATPDASPDVVPDATPDASPDVVPDATPDTMPDTTSPVPGLIPITLRPRPADALVAVPGAGAKEGARRVLVPTGGAVRVTVRRAGYRPKVVTVRGDGPRRLTVRLAKEAQGKVAFRFFPASAEVRLDGRPVKTGGANLLRRTLPVGEHKLELRAGGRRKVVRFEVREGATTNLRTLRLPGGPGGGAGLESGQGAEPRERTGP